MLLINEKNILPMISEFNKDKISLQLYKRDMTGYYSWILCCDVLDTEYLDKHWENIIDNLAIYVQSDLEVDIERYNLYVIFFINTSINSKLKNKIEQDKYSSRKIIVNNSMPKQHEELSKKVEELLFNINFREYKKNADEMSLEEWTRSFNKKIFDLFLEYRGNPKEIPTKLEEYISIF